MFNPLTSREMYSEPKMSRALVSKKKLSQLNEQGRSDSVELKSVTVDIGHTPRGNQSTGE